MGIVYKKFKATDYVMVNRNGRMVKEGTGLSLIYNNMRTDVLVIPQTAFDGAFAFDEMVTADYQTVCVQGAVTCAISDYGKAVKMADFTYAKDYEKKKKAAIELFLKRINNVVKAIVIRETGKREVRTVIKLADEMAALITEGLAADQTIENLGVSVLAVNILGIVARPETRKALEAAAREQILKEQDDAIYKRRNAAIEQERLIRENELNTEIKVAQKEKEKKEKEQEIKKRLLETDLEMRLERQEREQEIVKLEVENARARADEQAYEAAEMMKVYENVNVALIEACAMAKMDPKTLMAKAFLEMGENADKIGSLNMTPDLLAGIMGQVRRAG